MNNIPAAKANQIFDLLEKFAGYGFNKSHAAAYAVVAYQTAYLKANYPVEFFCAMMTNDMADTEKLSQYIAEARAMGIEVLPPDVNESQVYFAPAPSRAGVPSAQPSVSAPAKGGQEVRPTLAIRFGLAAIKGVGEIAVEAILKARRDGGSFPSLAELVRARGWALGEPQGAGGADQMRRVRLPRPDARDAVCANGPDAGAGGEHHRGPAARPGLAVRRLGGPLCRTSRRPTASLPEWPEHELLAHEKELLGFYVTGHPLTPYAPILEKYALANTATLAQLPPRSLTRIGGLIAAVQNGVSKKSGKPYSLVTLEDLEGSVQVLCLNENYEKYRELLAPGKAILVIGEVNAGDDKPKIFPAGNHAAGGRASAVHQASPPASAYRASQTGAPRFSAGTGRGASGQMPPVPLLRAAHGRGHLHGNARPVLRRALAGVTRSRRRSVWRGNLLREGGHQPPGASTAPMGATSGRRGWP